MVCLISFGVKYFSGELGARFRKVSTSFTCWGLVCHDEVEMFRVDGF